MDRGEHLAWCKKRALEYVDRGDVQTAWASFVSDMKKHPDTSDHSALELGFMLSMTGNLKSPMEMRKFIEGFN